MSDFPEIPELPDPPIRNEAPADFSRKASAFLGALPSFQAAMNTAGDWIASAWADVMAALPVVLNARDVTVNASDKAVAAANMAVSVVGAVEWDANETYAIGDAVWSPMDLQTYRRRTNGSTPSDPSTDPTNWEPVRASEGGASLAQLHANALSF